MSGGFKYTHNTYEKYGFPMIKVVLYFENSEISSVDTMCLHEGEPARYHAKRIARQLKYQYQRDKERDAIARTIDYGAFSDHKIPVDTGIDGSEVVEV